MAFQVGNFVKSAALSGLQRGINQSLGTSGSFLGNSIGSLLGGVSQSLFEVGNAFGTISNVTSLKLDSVVAGGETGFVSGKCPERAAAGDLEAGNTRQGIHQSMTDYMLDTDPTNRIAARRNNYHDGSTNYYPLGWASDKYFMTMRFFEYDRTHLFKAGAPTSVYTVTLPLPLELSDRQSAEYSTPNMQVVGSIMNDGLTNLGTMAQVAMTAAPEIAGNIAGSIGGALKNRNKFFGAIGATMAGTASAAGINTENLANAIEQYMGMAPNPQPSIAFKGPQLREFNFTWTFNPRDIKESQHIRETIERLKASSLPRKAFAESTGVLRYPHMCMLNFYPWDSGTVVNSIYGWGSKSIIRIKRCFISNITANYAPNGVPSFFQNDDNQIAGSPVFIQLSMTLKEIEYFTSEDWGGTGGSFDAEKAFKDAFTTVKDTVTDLGIS